MGGTWEQTEARENRKARKTAKEQGVCHLLEADYLAEYGWQSWSFYTEVEETDDRQVCAAEERETQTPPKEKERAFGMIAWRNKRKSKQPEPDYDTTAA